jgi:hypothetical protein
MTDIAVYVVDGLNNPLGPPVTFSVLNQVDNTWTEIIGSVLEEGTYVIPMEDNLTLRTCAPLWECNEQDVGTFPSENPYDSNSNYFNALMIILDTPAGDGDTTTEGGGTTSTTTDGGTTSTDTWDPSKVPSSPSCFVATAAYDTPLAPNVQFLRQLRDQTLKKSRSGELLFEKFFEKYNLFAPDIVEMMTADPQMKELIKLAFVNPIINYFKMVSQFPNQSPKDLKEPWRAFLMDAQNEYEKWVREVLKSAGKEMHINLWHDFSGLTAKEAADEIITAASYLFRSDESQEEYVNNLQRLNQIPLKIKDENESIDIIEKLKKSGLSKTNIKRITER